MSKSRLSINILTTISLIFMFAVMAQAQATRTWVSGVGDDVNPCSRTAPCKTWAGAISKTAKDGEINALDPGGFGTLTITKSITVDGTGTNASTLSALAPAGFTINITDAADVRKTVTLRNLTINGAASGTSGIRVLAALKVAIENVSIANLTTHGVDINVTASTRVDLNRVSVRNCAGNGLRAIAGAAVTASVSISDSSFFNCGIGVHGDDNSRISIRNTTTADNVTAGFDVNATTAGRFGEMNLVDCASYNNIATLSSRGVSAGGSAGGGTLRMAGTAIDTSNVAFNVGANGTIVSYGNNYINGSGPGVGALTPGNDQ
jgi:hypothetical protein